MKVPCRRSTADRERDCPTEPRVRRLADGRTAIYRQCLDCGEAVGSALSSASHRTAAPWDENLALAGEQGEAARRERLAREDAERTERQHADFWRRYDDYMQSKTWRARRAALFAAKGPRCRARLPGCFGAAQDVHHTTYAHLGAEPLFELEPVCRPCHEALHRDERARRPRGIP